MTLRVFRIPFLGSHTESSGLESEKGEGRESFLLSCDHYKVLSLVRTWFASENSTSPKHVPTVRKALKTNIKPAKKIKRLSKSIRLNRRDCEAVWDLSIPFCVLKLPKQHYNYIAALKTICYHG